MVKGMAVCVLVILAVAQLMVEPAQGVTCVEIASNLLGCLPYLTGVVSRPPAVCCNGVKRVKDLCVSTDDQKSACICIKQAALAIPGIKDGVVSSLPAACNQTIPFPVSTTSNCSSIGN